MLACLVEGDDVVEACPGLARVHVVVAAHLAAWCGELRRERVGSKKSIVYSICRVNIYYTRLGERLTWVERVVVHRVEGWRSSGGARHWRHRGTSMLFL